MKENEIKQLIPASCPHCQNPILLEMIMTTPHLAGILTADMITEAKKTAAKEVATLSIDGTTKKEALAWINDEGTIFSPRDVSQIIENLTKGKDD